MIACYCRVSSRHQKSGRVRKPRSPQWLQGNDMPPSRVPWFEDIETGATLHRPAFARCNTRSSRGIETVVVWKLDRLSRRQREGINLLARLVRARGTGGGLTQQIDLSGTVGRLVASVLFGLRRDRARVSARTPSGWHRSRQAERPLSRAAKGHDQGTSSPRRYPPQARAHRVRNCGRFRRQFAYRVSLSCIEFCITNGVFRLRSLVQYHRFTSQKRQKGMA